MARTATKPRRLTVTLREERVQGFAPLASGGKRVDREAGIVYGVKVVGKSSPNTHNVQGVEGTDYTAAALQAALPLYEGLKVNVDHPPRSSPGEARSSEDRLGKLVNARIHGGEIYADLHLLKTHPMAARVMEAAEKMPDAFALSHNALGKGDVQEKRYVITEIPEVRSVDVVADGGTNRSLFEGKEQRTMPKLTIRKLFEAAGPKTKVSARKFPRLAKAVKRLLEDEALMDKELEEDAPPAEHKEALKEGFRASVAKIVDDCLSGEGDPKECIARIGELLKTHDKLTDDDSDEEDLEEEDDSDDKDDDKDDAKDDAKKTEESRKYCTRLAKGYLNLQEAQQPQKALVDALVKLPDDDARLSLLESWPRSGSTAANNGRTGSAPRSSSPARPVQESAAAKSADEQRSLLLT